METKINILLYSPLTCAALVSGEKKVKRLLTIAHSYQESGEEVRRERCVAQVTHEDIIGDKFYA